jgi:hypothetical protein
MANTNNFYKNIPKSKSTLTALLEQEDLFLNVPKNWSVVVTDVEDSTIAIANGFHNNVNLCATGSIVTVLNILKTLKIPVKIAYFFGGDGSTFLVPNSVLEPVLFALDNYSSHAEENFKLNLRVGSISVEEIYKNNIQLKISKISHNPYHTTPVILGNGLKFAEKIIKNSFKSSGLENKNHITPDLEGMECRWDEVYPNATDKKVICLLVDCDNEKQQAEVYGQILSKIEDTFGDLEFRNPISTLKLKLSSSVQKIRNEMYARLGKYKLSYLVNNWVLTRIGAFYFKYFKAGKLYKKRVTQLSDTIMLDGFLNTVITGTQDQIDELKTFLDYLEGHHKITYGIHVTHASIMSCYIEDRDKKHIHFVDGTEGGYTSAATMFKAKMKSLSLR